MQEITFYVSPFKNNTITLKHFEDNIKNFCDLLDQIQIQQDIIKVPEYFFTFQFSDGTNFADYLYNVSHSSDLQNYLLEYISKEVQFDKIDYSSLKNLLDNNNTKSYKALVGLANQSFINESNLFVCDNSHLLSPRRFYLAQSTNLNEFKQELPFCFPSLYFHERVYDTISHFRKINEHSAELIRHLTVLNDYVKPLYLEYKEQLAEIYPRLQSEYNIIASGLGSNESSTRFKCMFYNIHGESIPVSCIPHTKLYTNYSAERIYFHWGDESIENNRILIGHIGGHWR